MGGNWSPLPLRSSGTGQRILCLFQLSGEGAGDPACLDDQQALQPTENPQAESQGCRWRAAVGLVAGVVSAPLCGWGHQQHPVLCCAQRNVSLCRGKRVCSDRVAGVCLRVCKRVCKPACLRLASATVPPVFSGTFAEQLPTWLGEVTEGGSRAPLCL